MSNKAIIERIKSQIEKYVWKPPSTISCTEQYAAFQSMLEALSLLKTIKPTNRHSTNSLFFEFIPKLYAVEMELHSQHFYNACCELHDLLLSVPIYEKPILFNVIDTIQKNLRGVNLPCLEESNPNSTAQANVLSAP